MGNIFILLILENEYNYYLNQMENISREDFDFTEDFI